jgi:hypothetical protein
LHEVGTRVHAVTLVSYHSIDVVFLFCDDSDIVGKEGVRRRNSKAHVFCLRGCGFFFYFFAKGREGDGPLGVEWGCGLVGVLYLYNVAHIILKYKVT